MAKARRMQTNTPRRQVGQSIAQLPAGDRRLLRQRQQGQGFILIDGQVPAGPHPSKLFILV